MATTVCGLQRRPVVIVLIVAVLVAGVAAITLGSYYGVRARQSNDTDADTESRVGGRSNQGSSSGSSSNVSSSSGWVQGTGSSSPSLPVPGGSSGASTLSALPRAASSSPLFNSARNSSSSLLSTGQGSSSSVSYTAQSSGSSSLSGSAQGGTSSVRSSSSSSSRSSTARGVSSSAFSSSSTRGGTSTSSTSSSAPQTVAALPYLHAENTSVVDSTGRPVRGLSGVNVGGWLVIEDWMCGVTDASDSAGRFALETLEGRFGVQDAAVLINAWRDAWITTTDLDLLQSLNFTMLRVPFSFRNLQFENSTGSAAGGQMDFSRLDWIVGQAGRRGMYVLLDFHIWRGQGGDFITPNFYLYGQVPDNYSRISHNDPCNNSTANSCAGDSSCHSAYTAAASAACAASVSSLCGSNFDNNYVTICNIDHTEAVAQRTAASAILTAVAAHFVGNSSVLGIDVINEPTGSYGNELWSVLYNAVRQGDPDRMVFMEVDGLVPAQYGWTNVVYSQHHYNGYNYYGSGSMTDAQTLAFNLQAVGTYINGSAALAQQGHYQVPQHVGEWHLPTADGLEDSWQAVAEAYKAANWMSTSWTYKTFNQNGWGTVQYSSVSGVDVLNDAYATILAAWRGMNNTHNQVAVSWEMQGLAVAAGAAT